jgi:periplasmic protein TonB
MPAHGLFANHGADAGPAKGGWPSGRFDEMERIPLKGSPWSCRLCSGAALVLGMLMTSSPAAAQAPEMPSVPPPDSLEAPPEKVEPERPIGPPPEDGVDQEELERSQGVLEPPETPDPGLVRPPPDDGAATTPVIPPPPPQEKPRPQERPEPTPQ